MARKKLSNLKNDQMTAGTKWNLKPQHKAEEFYRVESGVRKSGPWRLDTTNLVAGSTLPVFMPVQADIRKRTFVPVRNMEVYEKYVNGVSNLKIKVKKNPLLYAGMFIGSGSKGAEVSGIDHSSPDFDEITIKTALGEDVEKGSILFEATAAGGTKKKNVANFVLYGEIKVENDGPVMGTLLMQAYEVKESKLAIPIHAEDKVGLTCRFQFDY